MRTGAASAVDARRANDVIMINDNSLAGLWRYGDWRHVATGCNALVDVNDDESMTLKEIAGRW